jgi:hypothetical protein
LSLLQHDLALIAKGLRVEEWTPFTPESSMVRAA